MAPPALRLTLSEEDEVIEILLENVGEVPAVVSHVYVGGATTLRIADPSDLHIYKLQVNSTTLIAYIPYIAPGERVLLRCDAVSDVVSVSVKSWSALGSQASVKASLKAEGRREEAISGYLLIMAAAIIAVIGASLSAQSIVEEKGSVDEQWPTLMRGLAGHCKPRLLHCSDGSNPIIPALFVGIY